MLNNQYNFREENLSLLFESTYELSICFGGVEEIFYKNSCLSFSSSFHDFLYFPSSADFSLNEGFSEDF